MSHLGKHYDGYASREYSMLPRYCEVCAQTSGVTSCAANVWTKVSINTTAGLLNGNFSVGSGNYIKYDGVISDFFTINCVFSMASSAPGTLFVFAIYQNGLIIERSTVQIYVATGGDVGLGSIQALLPMDPNDYIEFWVKADGNANLTITNLSMILAS